MFAAVGWSCCLVLLCCPLWCNCVSSSSLSCAVPRVAMLSFVMQSVLFFFPLGTARGSASWRRWPSTWATAWRCRRAPMTAAPRRGHGATSKRFKLWELKSWWNFVWKPWRNLRAWNLQAVMKLESRDETWWKPWWNSKAWNLKLETWKPWWNLKAWTV